MLPIFQQLIDINRNILMFHFFYKLFEFKSVTSFIHRHFLYL